MTKNAGQLTSVTVVCVTHPVRTRLLNPITSIKSFTEFFIGFLLVPFFLLHGPLLAKIYLVDPALNQVGGNLR